MLIEYLVRLTVFVMEELYYGILYLWYGIPKTEKNNIK